VRFILGARQRACLMCVFYKAHCDAPGFHLGLITANDLVNQVKHVDFGQPWSTPQKHSQQTLIVNLDQSMVKIPS
jgi:hypothetical protein